MPMSRNSIKIIVAMFIATIMVACSPATTVEATTEVSVVASSDIPVIEQTGPIGEPIDVADGQRLLTWVSTGNRPGNQGASEPGELVYFNADGSTETVLGLPQGTTRVTACGPNSTSPDGASFALISTVGGGNEVGTIYLLQGNSSELTTVATGLNPASCIGSTPFQFSADGSQFAFIEWSADATNQTSPYGFLRIYDTASVSQVASFENVTAFNFTSTGATWVNFFPNDDGQATEVAITTWDGNIDTEISSLVADEENDCYYNSASTTEVGTGLVAIMGYRCNRGDITNTQWQLFNIDPSNRTAQLQQSDVAAGRYFVFSQTNTVFASSNGNNIFFTLPDGISSQTVGLYTSTLDGNDTTQLFDRSGIMPSVSDLPYDANNATSQLSPDGRYLAIVVNTPDNDATLNVFDLSDPSLPPISLDAGDRGDTIGSMVFNSTSNALYYVAGSDQGGNNSLFALDLTTGTESRIRRGRYAQMALSTDNSTIAIMNWVEFDPEEPRYLTLETINITSTVPSVIYVGGETDEEGKLINQSFAYPLAWR